MVILASCLAGRAFFLGLFRKSGIVDSFTTIKK